jgi:hypothetical protein
VVVDAMDPHPPKLGVLALGEDQSIFNGDPRLVIEPIEHPALELALAERSLVHAEVKGMAIVIARGADLAEAFDEVHRDPR